MPKWKHAAAVACAVYAGVAWAVPVFMLPFVNVLPFVHDRAFLERLPFSVVGSVLVVVTLAALNRARIPSNAGIHATGRERLVHRLGEIGGLVMFTLIGAALSANTLGLMAKALPSEEFETVVVVREVDHQGSRYRSVPRWPGQIPPPLATPNSPRQDRRIMTTQVQRRCVPRPP